VEPQRGTNYDPPPPPKSIQPAAEKPPAGPPPSFFEEIDWNDKANWLKAALVLGAVLLALRTFRQMKQDDDE